MAEGMKSMLFHIAQQQWGAKCHAALEIFNQGVAHVVRYSQQARISSRRRVGRASAMMPVAVLMPDQEETGSRRWTPRWRNDGVPSESARASRVGYHLMHNLFVK